MTAKIYLSGGQIIEVKNVSDITTKQAADTSFTTIIIEYEKGKKHLKLLKFNLNHVSAILCEEV